jgi:N,N'-diacetyllegionaminate synthase
MSRVLIIAEAGVNHNGDYKTARKLIKAASDSGADVVKFQTFKTEKIVSRSAKKANYQSKSCDSDDNSQFTMLKKLEIPVEWYEDLIQYAEECKISFQSTAFDLESLDFLNGLNLNFFKIPSGEITNKPLLQEISKLNRPVVLSTGMSCMKEISDALTILTSKGLSRDDVTVLHCNTEYPTPMKDVNLKAMLNIRDQIKVNIGYSDHTLGIEVPIAAVALGARVIEKHFTLDRNMEGPDHAASLEPSELKQMVISIRNIEMAISGSGEKKPSPSEEKNLKSVRKSLHVARDLIKGENIGVNDLISLRPGTGISPMEIDKLIGMKLKENLSKYDIINWKNLE